VAALSKRQASMIFLESAWRLENAATIFSSGQARAFMITLLHHETRNAMHPCWLLS
jgi:hypothetical protein